MQKRSASGYFCHWPGLVSDILRHVTIDSAARVDALTFLKSHSAGVIATVSKDYKPQASIVYFVCDDAFNIYFFTKRGSRKFNAISAHPQVAFVIGTQDVPQTLQMEGVASELTGKEDQDNHVPDLMQLLSNQTPAVVPMGKMDGEIVVMWLQPKWVRWADFSKNVIGNEKLFVDIPLE